MSLDDPQVRQALKKAHLHYVNDGAPGLSRRPKGRGFVYLDSKGKLLKSPKLISRIKKLAIPPAYRDIWISPDPRGHIQAVGRDARGRKQYRYHPDWRSARDQDKFGRMKEFAEALPRIRSVTGQHLKLPGLPREKVLAAIVSLLEKTHIRVGNEEYARQNHSYGLTTLRGRHAKIKGAKVHFEFTGKHGIRHEIDLEDARLARIVKSCQDLPGQEIFQYLDEEEKVHDLRSDDVNRYLQEISGQDFTAKDFRTWAGTLLAAKALKEYERFSSQSEAKKQILTAIENVAKRLGNTKTICRKCYIHPAVFAAHLDGKLAKIWDDQAQRLLKKKSLKLGPDEAAILVLLEGRLRQESKSA